MQARNAPKRRKCEVPGRGSTLPDRLVRLLRPAHIGGVRMATRNFSALTSGQSLAFDPNADVLFFDQSAISAGNLGVAAEGANSRVTVLSGTDAGKNVVLLNTTPLQLATTNVGFANASALLFGDNSTALNDNAANSLQGTAGPDLIQGFGGNHTISGRAGHDAPLGQGGNAILGTAAPTPRASSSTRPRALPTPTGSRTSPPASTRSTWTRA